MEAINSNQIATNDFNLVADIPGRAIRVMNDIAGIDCLTRSRAREYVVARWIIADYLAKVGLTEHQIARSLNLHHSTINHAKQQVSQMLSVKYAYRSELLIYKHFWEQIKRTDNELHILR